MTDSAFTITDIPPGHRQMIAVKELGRKYSKTLGFFPDGAFEDYAARRMLLVAENYLGELAGYCVFRSSKGRAIIAHLCVAEAFQGNGIARLLFEGVKGQARDYELTGIGLHCRRDYPAYNMWPKLGFAPRKTKRGRGMDGAELTFWWYDLNSRDLWSDVEEADDRLLVAIDCNIFRDLHDKNEERNREASFLQADWLSGQIELCVVDELLIEINRLPLPSPREQWFKDARQYRELKYDDARSQAIYRELRSLLRHRGPTTPQQDSDMRHIAKSAAASANIFLTRDGVILEQAAEIERQYGLQIKRPVELISDLNEAEQATLYQPARFASTDVKKLRPKLADVEALAAHFHLPAIQESRVQFMAKLRAVLSDPKRQVPLVATFNDTPLFLMASGDFDGGCRISLLRAISDPLAATSLRHALLGIIADAASRGGGRIEITDPNLSEEIQAVLHDLGLRNKSQCWQKLTLPFIGRAKYLKESLAEFEETASAVDALELEALYWPAKILGEGITTWAVPIQPGWATQLFETRFAEQLLFSSNKELILSRENVYYSAALQSGVIGSGRILWYISKSEDQPGSGKIRACSRLLKVRRGPAKILFNEFRRLGVFEWRDIMSITKGDPEKDILALHFADTQLFAEPLDHSMASEYGIHNNFTSPVRVAEEHFAAIYQRGMRLSTSS